MSRYLIRRIEENPAIALHTRTEIERAEGSSDLERVHWRNRRRLADARHPPRLPDDRRRPNTRWLDGCVALDDKGFVKTGPDLPTRT